MLVLNQRLLSLPIVGIQTGARLGNISSAIIDPRQLRVVAFYCEGPLIKSNSAILHSEDIREVSQLGLIIDSADDIMMADDLVRLKEILDFRFQLEGKLVVEENGRKIGKVVSYSVEVSTFYIIKLHVRPGILAALGTSEKIIDRSQITEITPQSIIVKPAVVTQKEPEVAKPVSVDNPFRKTATQSDFSGDQPD